jgi:anhydro-N-acetylmuramic acid kinase
MSELGIDPREKEALAFALIGFLTTHGLPGSIPSCTGAESAQLLGSLTPGKSAITLPEVIKNMPKKLKMLG